MWQLCKILNEPPLSPPTNSSLIDGHRCTTSQGSSRAIFAGANFLPAKQNRASPRGEHLANLPLGTIITIRPLHGFGPAILTESLTTPLGRRDPFWLVRNHHVFKLRHHYFGPSGGVLPLSCCCPFVLV